jgi:hypothetical protein
MELLVDKNNNNQVHIFNENEGLKKVWEPQKVTRFRFKNPVKDEKLKTLLERNKPTCGIIFRQKPYIGTNDGNIYTPTSKIQRIPEIITDPQIFIEEYPYRSQKEKELFKKFQKIGTKALEFHKRCLINRIFEINLQLESVMTQQDYMQKFINNYFAIKGFVIDKDPILGQGECLYDGHLLGITRTNKDIKVNNLTPLMLYQITKNRAGFIPKGTDGNSQKTKINGGIERKIDLYCVDHRSLWDLSGREKLIERIYPRNQVNYTPAIFATNGKLIAILQTNELNSRLDILERKDEICYEKIKSIQFDNKNLPLKLFIKNNQIHGIYPNAIRNFSTDRDIFLPKEGNITSFSQSQLCTIYSNNKTFIYNPFNSKRIGELEGYMKFLSQTFQ